MWLVLAQLSEKQLDATIRELENQNFCLNLDEGAVSMVLLREGLENDANVVVTFPAFSKRDAGELQSWYCGARVTKCMSCLI